MGRESELIYDVTDADFEERVIRASSERPVVVDFWAPWCAPCRMLGPALEKVVASFGGDLALAKLNVDQAKGTASRYGIRGIPAVKVFRGGEVVAEFVGAVGEAEVRRMLARVVPSEADRLAAEAAKLAEAGRTDEAEPLLREALGKQSDHPAALVGLALAAVERGDHVAARESLSRVPPGSPGNDQAQGLLARLDFLETCAGGGGRDAAEKSLAERPDDLDAMYAAATCLAAGERYAEALDLLLRVVERERAYSGGAAKDAMVKIFSIVGKGSDLAGEYRSRLARALY